MGHNIPAKHFNIRHTHTHRTDLIIINAKTERVLEQKLIKKKIILAGMHRFTALHQFSHPLTFSRRF